MFPVYDEHGKLVAHVEADQLRDASGKRIGTREGADEPMRVLAKEAARRMTGRPVLMDIGQADVTAATAARFTVATPGRPDYVADRVCPVRMVSHDRGTFFAETASDAVTMVEPSAGGAAGAQPVSISPGFVNTTFVTNPYALGALVPRRIKANADFNLERLTLRRLVQALRLAREQRVMTLLTTSGNFAASNRIAVVAGNKWNGGATANPLNDMMSALAASYLPANAMILPENVAPPFYVQPQASTGIRDYVQADGEMPEVLYARAKVKSGGALSYLWAPSYTGGTGGAGASNVAVVRVSPDPDEISTAITCRWAGESPDGEIVDGMVVRTFHVPANDADMLVVAHNDVEVILSNQVGAVIVGATQ